MEIGINNLSQSYDLIVIGSGPAGLTLARRYDDLTTNNRTLIVESGSRSNQNSEAQELSLVDASGDVDSSYYSFHSQRIFGGTSTVWSGWCKVLETRAFLNDEWPLSYDELQAYYPKAADILGLPGEIYTHPETPFPRNANLVCRPYYISSQRRFDVLFRDWAIQSPNVDVLFNHTVTNIGIYDGQEAQYVSIQESSASRTSPVKVFGNKIVLACGGIHNARLLQLSLPRDNALPIGSYFCQHPHITGYAHIILDEDIFDHIKSESASGTEIFHSIALSSEFSYVNHCESVNFLMQLQSPTPSLANLLGRNRRSVVAAIHVHAEMRPLASNKITLSNTRRDFLDQPIAQVVLRFSLKGIHAAYNYVNAELIRSGIGRLSVPREVKNIRNGGGHMIGSTRMGKDPSDSVTDAHARVWGMKNLYIAGSSLFPATGAANPTFTILALSIRLADYLAGRLK